MTLKNNRAPLLYYVKLCASFQSHGWIKTRVTVRKPSIRVKIGNFLSCDLVIWWMTLKTMGHLFYTMLSFVHQFKAIGELVIFLSPVTLKFDEWPLKTLWHFYYASPRFVHYFIAINASKLESQSGNVQIGSKAMIFLAVWPWNLTDDLEKQ